MNTLIWGGVGAINGDIEITEVFWVWNCADTRDTVTNCQPSAVAVQGGRCL